MKKLLISIALLALSSLHIAKAADVNLDLSNAGVQVTGPTTLRLNNVIIDGAKNPFSVEFGWDPKTSSFRQLSKGLDISPKWRLTASEVKFSPDTGTFSRDLNEMCASEFGFGNVYADWADVKAWIENDSKRAQTFINSAGLAISPGKPKFVLSSFQSRPFSSMMSQTDTHYLNGVTLDPSGAKDNVLGGTIYAAGQWAYPHLKYNVLCNNKSGS